MIADGEKPHKDITQAHTGQNKRTEPHSTPTAAKGSQTDPTKGMIEPSNIDTIHTAATLKMA